VEDIRAKTKRPQANGICERFHKTMLNEFYRVTFRKKIHRSSGRVASRFGALAPGVP
jgi:transposase InsO family protein